MMESGKNNLLELARAYDCFETVDASVFQRNARILQSMWREERGYPLGEGGGDVNSLCNSGRTR